MHPPASPDRSGYDAPPVATSWLSLAVVGAVIVVGVATLSRLLDPGDIAGREIAVAAPLPEAGDAGEQGPAESDVDSPVTTVAPSEDRPTDMSAEPEAGEPGDQVVLSRVLKRYCLGCHGATAPEAGLSLVDLSDSPVENGDPATWKSVYQRMLAREMPPVDEPQPAAVERRQALRSLGGLLRQAGFSPAVETHPLAEGNAIDHRALFSPPADAPPATTPARLWRVTGPAYEGYVERLIRRFSLEINNRGDSRIAAPWNFIPQRDFADDASVHRVGEAEIEQLLRNATLLAGLLVRRHSGKVPEQGEFIRELATLIQAGDTVSREQVANAISPTFRALLAREPTPDEADRHRQFVQQIAMAQGGRLAAEQLLIALLCQTEVIHRVEIPDGSTPSGWLSPHHLARSLAFALTDSLPDAPLARAAVDGRLTTREEVQAQVARILRDRTLPKTRVLRFFREYFGYHLAPGVFKDEATLKKHGLLLRHPWNPGFFVSDADRLVEEILADDRDVLRELLTTTRTFVMTVPAEQQRHTLADAYRLKKPKFESDEQTVMKVYGISLESRSQWDPNRAYEFPSGQRLGLLTHPAWLIAHSSNFDNHVIQRGRWIRERLLGGLIPEVPITVNAMLPEEPHRTLRDRMRVTRAEACWKCHRQMDPLGFPFEQFDHLGQYRTGELVAVPVTGGPMGRNPPGDKPTGREFRIVPLNTTGEITGSIDPALDGRVSDPFELIRRLAGSELVEQVFVRHAFRYFLGRSETLADGPTLVAAHDAYRRGGGSMNDLITVLLTSDPFLRRETSPEQNPPGQADLEDPPVGLPETIDPDAN
ncbi:MAG: DUF1588 domain-containing protein [Planctomycetaceae bacterium]